MRRPSGNIILVQLALTPAGKRPENKAKINSLLGGTDKNKKAAVAPGGEYSESKEWLQRELQHWCNTNLLELHKEFRFAKPRLWKFDWAITAPAMSSAKIKIAIEYEGIMKASKGHTSPKHYTKDTDKYGQASQLGWILLRYTVLNYKNVIKDLTDIFNRML